MAYVKQITIHNTLIKSLKYVSNPDKTEDNILVSGINCSSNYKLAYKQMTATKNQYNKQGKVLGYHFMQSFKKGEISDANTAHEIGVKWANEITKGKYEILVATHIDKDHMHNHFILNSVCRETGEKYNSCKNQLKEIREESDKICNEYNLSIINKKSNNINKENDLLAIKNMSYNIWLIKNNFEDQRKSTMKYVTNKIDEIISSNKVRNLDELVEKLKEFNIETKYKNRKGELYKNISFKVIGSSQEKGFRGQYNHSIENLINRINDPSLDEKRLNKNEWQRYASKNYPRANYKEFIKLAVDKIIESGRCNNIDELADILKDKYNITMDYLTEDLKVKKRIKFFANDCPYEKYSVGSYGLAGKESSSKYEKDGFYERIENAKVKNEIINNRLDNDLNKNNKILNQTKEDPTLIKFTGKLKTDFELLKAYFEYTKDSRLLTVERCISYLDATNITELDDLIKISNANAELAAKDIDEKNNLMKKIKSIESKEESIIETNKNIQIIKDRIANLSSGLTGKIKNKSEISKCNEEILLLKEDINNFKLELLDENKNEIVDSISKLESSISRRRHLQENFKDILEIYNNKEKLAKESNRESKIQQADRRIEEIKRKVKTQEK
ncbi:relaxase/mobilization nuclease domain-containing protein [uncultured Clostridium sp.]|uniref:relaxase/mobilization nuclease domain-containing protein n=1 Tax=uncultured Clostridium sp. TaxID=59620 RepID=UPI002582B8D7|nr:relaxase/mobilization nuclease domain-containing protein [uncultured Clostridium sp.]